jgi:RecA-family ATPase
MTIFPDHIQRQLDQPRPVPPGRHDALMRLSFQMVCEGFPDDIIFDALRAWCPDRDKTDYEILKLIEGAHQKSPKSANPHSAKGVGGNNHYGNPGRHASAPTVKTFEPSGDGMPLPTGLEDVHPVEFFERIFAPQDNIEIAWKDEQGRLDQSEIKTVAQWGEAKVRQFGNVDGWFYCINPLLDGANRRNDANVASYRHLLVELEVSKTEREFMDIEQKEAACERFYSALVESRLPLAAIYTSGDASVHGLVKVNAADHTEWKMRMETVYAYCAAMPGLDPSNKNPSRLSRLPGAMRGERLQTLLSWECGAARYEEWESTVGIDDGTRKLQGCSLAELVHQTPSEEDTLLGNRYLCRGGGMLIVAPSGHGKSVLSCQAAIEWGVGRASFGIKAARPLRTLIVQAEDDRGDCIEMSQIVRHLEITGDKFDLLKRNVWLEPVNDVTGFAFIQVLDGFLVQYPADIVIINPLTAYLGADDKDTKAATLFLRNWLNPVLGEHNCAAIIIHHTPKTNFASTDGYKPSDWMYRGAGAATITNWARAILVIDPGKTPGVYRFIAAKRGKRIGWGLDQPVFETYWAHCHELHKLLWVPANEAEIKAEAKTHRDVQASDLLPFIPGPDEEPVIIEQIIDAARGKIGEKKVRSFIKVLLADKNIDAIEIKRQRARPERKYTRKAVPGSCQ